MLIWDPGKKKDGMARRASAVQRFNSIIIPANPEKDDNTKVFTIG
jgi:hypothetical protein